MFNIVRWLPTRITALTYLAACIMIIWKSISVQRATSYYRKIKIPQRYYASHLWRLFPKKCQRRACASLFVRTAAVAVTEPPEKRRPAAARRWRQQDWAGAEPPRAFVIYNKLHSSRVSFTLSLSPSLSFSYYSAVTAPRYI